MNNNGKFPFIRSNIVEDYSWAILLIPLWWILGFRFFIFHALVIFGVLKLLSQKKQDGKPVFPRVNWVLVSFVGIYLISIVVNIRSIATPRLIATLNNMFFWVLGILIIFTLYNSLNRENIKKLIGVFPVFGLISSLFVIIAVSAGFILERVIEFKSILMSLLPKNLVEVILSKAQLLGSSLMLIFVGQDKLFSKPFPRSPGFNIYSTAFGLTIIVLITMTYAHYRMKKDKRMLPILFLEVIALFFSLSRTSILGFLLAASIVALILGYRKVPWKIVLPVLLVALVVLLIIIPPQEILDTFSNFRKGSTAWRTRLYERTIDEALNKPVLGSGFKPRPVDFPIPIGSHSTFFGVVYRTGLAGLAIFMLFWFFVLRKWWVQKKVFEADPELGFLWPMLGVALISGLFWMITDDLDAPPIAAFLYFIVVGMIVSLERLKKKSTSK